MCVHIVEIAPTLSRGGQMGAKEPIVAPPGFLVALWLRYDNLLY